MSQNGDPVKTWFDQLDSTSRQAYSSYWTRFIVWLKSQRGFEQITPTDLLRLQRQLNRKQPTEDDPTPELRLPKLFKTYANSLNIRYTSKLKMWTVIRSFFKYNDCPFPEVRSVRITSEKIPVQSRLTLETVRQGIGAANVRDKSWLLTKWMSFQDQERLNFVNRSLADHVVSEIKAGKDLIRLDFIGRKQEKGKKPYFSYIGKDAVDALKRHFETNGYPEPGEPLWKNNQGGTLCIDSYGTLWFGLLERLAHVPKRETRLHKGVNGMRYGMGLHEFRDIAKSLCHTRAKADGFDMDCVKFWMGHVDQVDPNRYDKFYEDTAYVESQYRIAERYLNILSTPEAAETRERIEEQGKEIERLQAQVDELSMFLQHMATSWKPIEPEKKEPVVIEWDPSKHGLKWPLPEPKKQPKREKT